MNTRNDTIREQIAEHYTQAVRRGSCCCSGGGQSTGAEAIGYEAGVIANLPVDAVRNSFGCGAPLAFADVQPGETVLDLGSGAGIDLLLAAEKVGPAGRVIGVDMTEEMIARAESNIRAAGYDNVEVRRGFIEELPVADSSVDLVISNCVLNLSPEKPRVFAEIARVLRPGGRMRVSDLVAENLPDWVRESAALTASCIGGAVSEQEYLEGLRAAGLTKVAVEDRLVYGASQLESLVLDDLPHAGGCCGDDLLKRASEALDARVASILVTARKPLES